MKQLNAFVLKLRVWNDTRGQDLVEYALAAGLVAVAAVGCMPMLSGTVAIGSQSWKIQGNWSNAAANAGTGYANGGCIQTS